MVARMGSVLVLAAAVCYAPLATAVTGQGSPQLETDTTATTVSSGSGSSGVDGKITVNQTRLPVDELRTISGIPTWVDPTTPDDKQSYVTSRGETWELVMSDEFGDPARNFTPGGDHLWTSIEKPDGVNGALEFYAHNMSYVSCETAKTEGDTTSTNTTAVCYLAIEIQDVQSSIKVYNMYSRPPTFQIAKFYYRAAMLQSWNKFCYQGGMVEVRAQLPGAVAKKSKNPDVAGGPNARAATGRFYPTWPGIWMLGNLGRAIFSGSTGRMWPYSYNECNPAAFDPKNQRISACESNPGHGLNPNQGRGAPEIDLLEGGGVAISSSIQIGPGLKTKYRRIPVNMSIPKEDKNCFYNAACQTPGANLPNVPTSLYKPRKYQTWYKGMRYSFNSYCAQDPKEIQSFAAINASIGRVIDSKCTLTTCPASNDVQADLSFIPNDKTKSRWGINTKGTCAAVMNNYMGSFLCDPDNSNPMCVEPRNATTAKTNVMDPFAYQMDALSANWGVHVGAYTGFVTYQVEWVMGDTGYLRWMLFGNPIYEIPAETVVNAPQTAADPNPQLTFPEEPMYIIFNVALSNQWGAMPPNAGKGPCSMKTDNPEEDALNKLVCDSFPMYMKVDYIRVYQDKSPNSTMAVGCDPKTHPTRQWIFDHLEEYQDDANPYIEVDGGAYCRNDLDCMIPFNTTVNFATGNCVEWRCKCNTKYWGGPRCTTAIKITDFAAAAKQAPSYGPPLYLSITIGSISIVMTCLIIALCTRRRRRKDVELQQKLAKMKTEMTIEKASLLPGTDFDEIELARNSNATPQSRYQPLSAKGA